MNLRLIVPATCVLVALTLVPTGCGDDESSPDNRPNPVAVIGVASDLSVVAGIALQAATLGDAAYQAASPGLHASSPADTLFPPPLTCPVVAVDMDSTARDTMTFDYGAGCESTMDGQTTSGILFFDIGSNSLGNGNRYLAGFADTSYTRSGRSITGGILAAEERNLLVDVTAVDAVLSGIGLGGILNATFTAEGPSGSGPPFYCRDWTVAEGEGDMLIGNLAFTFTVLDTLVLSTCCAYPVQGLVSITSSGLTPAFFDFGTGTCDSLATLTIGGESQPIVMTY